jgi:hypothetical protein
MRSAITFIVVMAIGAALALLLDRIGLGFIAGFALGVGYLMAASLGINTWGQRA